jgi:hypothetical protein
MAAYDLWSAAVVLTRTFFVSVVENLLAAIIGWLQAFMLYKSRSLV